MTGSAIEATPVSKEREVVSKKVKQLLFKGGVVR